MSGPVMIMGAGHQGLAMAAHLGSEGVECRLWNRSEAHIADLAREGSVSCSGIVEGEVPVGTVSTSVRECLAPTVMVAAPSSAHRDIAGLLAPLVDGSFTVILNPGRTLGALDFVDALVEAGCAELPVVAEAQTIVYTCRRDASRGVRIFALKDGVPMAGADAESTARALDVLPACIRGHFRAAASLVETSLGNVGMVLHCAPVLMNVGWIESERASFEYYYDGISPTIARLLEGIDAERLSVASAMGCPVEPLTGWLSRTYGTRGSSLYEHLQSNEAYRGIDAPKTVRHRYVEEDVPNGLVPLESLGERFGVPTPLTSSVVTFACQVMGEDYRASGRKAALLDTPFAAGLPERRGAR